MQGGNHIGLLVNGKTKVCHKPPVKNRVDRRALVVGACRHPSHACAGGGGIGSGCGHIRHLTSLWANLDNLESKHMLESTVAGGKGKTVLLAESGNPDVVLLNSDAALS